MMKKAILFIFVSAGCFAQGQSLDILKEKAKANNPQAELIELIQENSNLQIKNLNAGYLPQTSLNGQASWQSAVTSLAVKVPGFTIVPPPKDQYRATIDVSQNIWDSGLIKSQKKMTEASNLVEQKKVAADLQMLDETANNLFFLTLLAEKQKAIAAIMLKDLTAKIDKVKASISNGVAIKNNLLILKAKKIETEQLMSDINRQKITALDNLSLLTGEKYTEQSVFSLPDNSSFSENENKRKELELFSAQKDNFLYSEQFIKAKNNPKLALFATGGYGRPGLNMLSSTFQPYFIGGLQLKIPLSQIYSGSQSSEIQQLKISQKKIDKQKENFLLQSNLKLTNLKSDLARLKSQIASDQELIGLREEIRLSTENQLENGIITVSDYLNELNNLDVARQNLAIHEVQYLQTQQNIRVLLGL